MSDMTTPPVGATTQKPRYSLLILDQDEIARRRASGQLAPAEPRSTFGELSDAGGSNEDTGKGHKMPWHKS